MNGANIDICGKNVRVPTISNLKKRELTLTSSNIAFVGLGYIGLPTAVVLAHSGVNVVGIDTNAKNVARINRGEITIVEPGLEPKLKTALESGYFRATTEYVHADVYIVAVPTPFTSEYDVDLKYIFSVADSIAPLLSGNELIILESTSPPHTTHKMAERILEQRDDLVADGAENPNNLPVIYFAHCPERILPGKAMEELITNDRIIGGMSPEATQRASDVYRSFCKGELLSADAVTAEMAKLTENSFRDVNIAFANELSLICENLGINVWELIKLANHHPRVNILQPGPGVGGHCIAVDPWFIVSSDPKNAKLIRTAREVNDNKPAWVLERISQTVSEFNFNSVAMLGISFKADIDDLRTSPALSITEEFAKTHPNINVLTVEPNISELPENLNKIPNVVLTELNSALRTAEVIVLLVDHKEFKAVSATALKGKTIIDTKGLWH